MRFSPKACLPLLSLILICVLVLVIGRLALPADKALRAVITTGYWWMLVATIIAGVVWWKSWRAHATFRVPRWQTVVLIAAVTLCWHAHERFGYKILADEILLMGTSQNMHFDRDVGYGVRATDIRGPFEILESVLDKRPLLYPFLVSVLHDWTGYRTANAFWLNAGLGVVFLGLLHHLATRVGGNAWAGDVAVLFAGGIPLFAQQASGGGFELLNLTLLTAWIGFGMAFMEKPDERRQDALVISAVLLASARYESLLYLVPTAVMLILAWRRRGNVAVTPVTVLAPVLLLPTLWLQYAFEADAGRWELQSRGADTVFSLDYLAGNLGHAAAHFLSFDGYQPNSPVFGAIGLLALPFLMLWTVSVLRSPKEAAPGEVALVWTSAGLWAGAALLMLYFWGQFDHPVIHRLSLPTQLLMLLALVVALAKFGHAAEWRWKAAAAVAAVTLFAWSLPVMAKNAYGRTYTPGLAYAWREQFLTQIQDRQVLVIDRDSQFWITQQISATPIAMAEARKEGIAFHLRNRSFSDIFVFQSCQYDEQTGIEQVYPEDRLSPAFELEPVAQLKLAIGHVARISRVKSIHEGDKVIAAPGWPADTRAKISLTPEQSEAARQAYLDNWLKQLP